MGTSVTSEPVLRRLTASDAADVAIIEGASQPHPWTEQIIRDELSGENRIYLAMLAEGALFGFGGVMVVGEEAHVTNLLVAPDQRRRGLASRILIGLIEAALERGARHLTLEVRSRNGAAISLYRKFGMAPVGIRKDYYGDDDALIMWVYDIDSEAFSSHLEGLK